MGKAPMSNFRDITLATDRACVARASYDYCTGFGSLQSTAPSGTPRRRRSGGCP